jgi:signal transduction histidine kinase
VRSLRARLFITVGVVLAAAIAASSLLSRRATLVEVRTVENRQVKVTDPSTLDAAGARVEAYLRTAGAVRSAALDGFLASVERDAGRPLLLTDLQPRVLGGSDRVLSTAVARKATGEGTLSLEIGSGADRGLFEFRGAPTYAVKDVEGATVAHLFMLPDPVDRPRADGPAVPPWILATTGTAVTALVLTFAMSRRILRPVGALTAAADRMRRGDLAARVPVTGDDEISELSRAFNGMAERIAETERLRRQMVSDVAHELRSPVTNLRCTLEAMQDGLVQPDRTSIDTLHDETLFLQRLIADLQDLSLADAGRLELHPAPLDIAAVVSRAATVPAGASGAMAAVRVDADPGLPTVVGDGDRLEQVVRNLVANARTHTPADGTIDVRVRRDAETVRIEVRDTGRGIAREHLPHVFDRFYRADRSRARATGGAGLGLAIVRQLVAAHGGTVSASSDGPGMGTVFVVTLPSARA